MKDRKIISILEIFELADNRKSIYHTHWKKHINAAFLQNFQARLLQNMIKSGYLYTYICKTKQK